VFISDATEREKEELGLQLQCGLCGLSAGTPWGKSNSLVCTYFFDEVASLRPLSPNHPNRPMLTRMPAGIQGRYICKNCRPHLEEEKWDHEVGEDRAEDDDDDDEVGEDAAEDDDDDDEVGEDDANA
jgi:hypothetical protein